MTHPPSLYRAYLKHLRYIPDPHIWRTHQPYFRSLLDRPLGDAGETGEGSRDGALREGRRLRGLNRAKRELNKLKAAVACHPHALRRLLEEAYARRGRLRWELVNTIVKSSPDLTPTSSPGLNPPLPAPLIPLKPPPIKPNDAPSARLRSVPAVALRKAAKKSSERDWRKVSVPLVLPLNAGWKTGWEGMGVVEALRVLAGIEEGSSHGATSTPISIISQPSSSNTAHPPPSPPSPANLFPSPLPLARDLPTYQVLPPHIRLLLPHRRLPSIPRDQAHPSPRPAHTRPNPRTWGPVRVLRTRLVRRMYRRLWDSLVWVRPAGQGWEKVGWEDMLGGSSGVGMQRDRGEKKKWEWLGRMKIEDTV